jgi:hypothetical protein
MVTPTRFSFVLAQKSWLDDWQNMFSNKENGALAI